MTQALAFELGQSIRRSGDSRSDLPGLDFGMSVHLVLDRFRFRKGSSIVPSLPRVLSPAVLEVHVASDRHDPRGETITTIVFYRRTDANEYFLCEIVDLRDGWPARRKKAATATLKRSQMSSTGGTDSPTALHSRLRIRLRGTMLAHPRLSKRLRVAAEVSH